MKPAAAILIMVIMVLSVAGFAFNSSNFQSEPEEVQIPNVIREQISTQDQIYILRAGKVLIEHFYTEGCTDCLEKNAKLEEFVGRLEGYLVINEVEGNETRLDMIGSGGMIVNLENSSLEYGDLIGPFCEVAIAQPRACLVREF
jgi:thiol-disulfide isomerase/thioredoxin